jgi:uncharacterized membrane protein YphA (DoxX/SURF4 family)
MSDEIQWHPKAALAALLIMAILFAVAGLVKLAGIADVELGFFEYSVTSRRGTVLWIVTSLLFCFLFDYLLRGQWTTK